MAADNWSLALTKKSGIDEAALSAYIAALVSKPFDLSKDYMLRAELIETGKQDHVLVVTTHHIASDGWSTSILVKEVVELYTAHTAGKEAQLSDLPIQYADYAIWQRNYLQGEVLEAKLDYWKAKLADTPRCNCRRLQPSAGSKLKRGRLQLQNRRCAIGTIANTEPGTWRYAVHDLAIGI